MDNARVLLAFAALLALALGFVRLGVRGALAPLCAVATVSLGLSLFGALGLLWAGGLVLYLLAAACALLLLYEALAGGTLNTGRVLHSGKGGNARIAYSKAGLGTGPSHMLAPDGAAGHGTLPAPGFGFWFFAIGGLVFLLILWLRQPLFTGWDEFSMWGTAQKLMHQTNELYTTAPVGWARFYSKALGENIGWVQTQKPAYMVFGYFFQFVGAPFAPWQAYAACDVFQLALLATLFAPFEGKLKKHWNAALPLALAALLLPYVFYHYQEVHSLSPAYMDTLGDMPLGLCFGAVFACCLGAAGIRSTPEHMPKQAAASLGPDVNRRQRARLLPRPHLASMRRASILNMLPIFLALALLTMTKDTGFALALVAAVAMAADAWLCAKGIPRIKRLLAAGGRLAAGFLAVLMPFLAWEAYISTLTGASRVDSAVTTGGPGMLQFPALFVQDLLSPEKSERFIYVTNGMLAQFLHSKGNMLGTGLLTALLCLGLVGLAAVLYKSPLFRRRCLCFGVLSALGFAAYYLLLTMMYLYLFRADQIAKFESYDRYVYPYYIGWLLGALVLLGVAICRGPGRRGLLGKAAVLAFAALLFLRVGQLVPAQYTLVGAHADEFADQRAFSQKTEALQARLDPAGRTFLVKSGDVGMGWFMYCYEMLPWQMDYSFGGGAILLRRPAPGGGVEEVPLTTGQWLQYLAETGCTTVFIDFADYDFIHSYGNAFSDGLAAYENGETDLYAVVQRGGATTLEPVLNH